MKHVQICQQKFPKLIAIAKMKPKIVKIQKNPLMFM